eukprot:9337739-Pyramimonas_sp.AAC.2
MLAGEARSPFTLRAQRARVARQRDPEQHMWMVRATMWMVRATMWMLRATMRVLRAKMRMLRVYDAGAKG